MEVISCRPGQGQFWVACNKEEAEKWFVPLLDKSHLKQFNDVLMMNEERKIGDAEYALEYERMIKETMEVNEVAYAYFNVSLDISICYSDVAHHPFHQLWNGYSPFRKCDHIVIDSLEELKNLVMTYQGKPYEEQ